MTLTLTNIVCGYGKNVVVRVHDVLLPSGQTSLLVGHNGSGKTTFLKTLCGVISPIEGHLPPGTQTCLLPEEVGFPGSLPSGEIFRSLCPNESQSDKILDELEIPLKKRFDQLSKGNRQKLRIAITESLGCSLSKTILCLDEPLSGLDVSARRKIIQAWNGEGELGLIWGRFGGHRIISQHSGRAPRAFQVIVVADGRTRVFPPIETCDDWPKLISTHHEN